MQLRGGRLQEYRKVQAHVHVVTLQNYHMPNCQKQHDYWVCIHSPCEKVLSFTTHVNAITDQGMGKPLLYIMPTKMWKQCKTTCTCITRGYAPTNNGHVHVHRKAQGDSYSREPFVCIHLCVQQWVPPLHTACSLLDVGDAHTSLQDPVEL